MPKVNKFGVKEFVQKHDPNLTYAIPAGMYVSRILGTLYCLQQGKEMDSSLQKWLLAVLKRVLGVKDNSHAFMVCHERVWIGTPKV